MTSPVFSSPGETGIATTTSPILIEGVMLPLPTASSLTPRRKEPSSKIDSAISMIEKIFEEGFRARYPAGTGAGLARAYRDPESRIVCNVNVRTLVRRDVEAGMTGDR